jgi:uncharacterized protein YndB with AHSA1/START domain
MPEVTPLDREVVSTRVFDAPRERLFGAFLDPQLLAAWWGPAGSTNAFETFEPRAGGAWHFTMRGPDGTEYPMVKEFLEVTAPARIVLRHVQASHGFVMTMEYDALAPARTLLTWRLRFDDAADLAPIRQIIVVSNEENFDRLAATLAAGSR